MTDLNVPFYANTSDNLHCFQAALKMVLKYFQPNKEYLWKELDRITDKAGDLWTWPIAALLWLKKNGFEVKKIGLFDYEQFAKKGSQYLSDVYGYEVARIQNEHSNIEQERKLAKKLTREIAIERQEPRTEELAALLNAGYLLICNVNSYALYNKQGYAGHSVVVKGYYEDGLIIHDPGLPPAENKRILFPTFERAWAYPNNMSKNIIAINGRASRRTR